MSPDTSNTVAEIQPARALSALGLVGVVLAIALSWGAMGHALESLEDVWQDRVEALAEIHETTAPFYRMMPMLSEIGRPVATDSAAVALTEARGESAKAWRLYLSTTLTEAEVTLMNQTTGPVTLLHAGADTLIAVLKRGNHDEYVAALNATFLPRLNAVAQRMEALVSLQQTVTRERVAQARSRYQSSRWLLVLSGAVVVTIGLMGMRSGGRSRGSP